MQMLDDDGRGNLVMSLVTPNVPVQSRIIRDMFVPVIRDEVVKVLREARRNGNRVVVNKAGRSWSITVRGSVMHIEIHAGVTA